MGILRSDRVSGLGGANAINGSVFFGGATLGGGGGTGNNILITEVSSDFTFGTGDFTIEGWFYTPDLSNWNLLVADNVYQSTGGWSLYLNTDPDVDWWKGAASVVSGATPTVSTWHHIAFSRASGTNRVFLDGALGASASDSTNYTGTQILIGANQLVASTNVSQWGFKGYASNVRVIKGEAIYTAAFTAPTSRLEKTDNTVLLCCQSPGNVLQEATGKILYTLNKPVATHIAPDVGEDHGTTLGDNTKFDTLSYLVPPGGTTAESNRGRGVIGGYYSTPQINTVSYVNLQSTGNSANFGDLVSGAAASGCFASSTRGVWCGGYYSPGTFSDMIQYVTIATTGNAVDSTGNLPTVRKMIAGLSNDTRGINAGGTAPDGNTEINTIDYVTIASLGNSSDFGDLTAVSMYPSAAGNTTRGIIYLGATAPNTQTNIINYITIASTGDAQDFGDATFEAQYRGGLAASSSTRLVNGGGWDHPANTNIIDYVTIATTGDATDFGDLTRPQHGGANMSNSIRGVFAGAYGNSPAQYSNSIEYVTIATTGDAVDFGDIPDISGNSSYSAGCSDSHGGIS